MSYRWRKIVGGVALGGVVLPILGMAGLRELMAMGTVPTEMLGRRVIYTVVSLFLGVVMVVWCLVSGILWAGMKVRE